MGRAVLKNPRVVIVTDPIFGPRSEVQADLYEDNVGNVTYERFICVVSLGKPVNPPDDEPAG